MRAKGRSKEAREILGQRAIKEEFPEKAADCACDMTRRSARTNEGTSKNDTMRSKISGGSRGSHGMTSGFLFLDKERPSFLKTSLALFEDFPAFPLVSLLEDVLEAARAPVRAGWRLDIGRADESGESDPPNTPCR